MQIKTLALNMTDHFTGFVCPQISTNVQQRTEDANRGATISLEHSRVDVIVVIAWLARTAALTVKVNKVTVLFKIQKLNKTYL